MTRPNDRLTRTQGVVLAVTTVLAGALVALVSHRMGLSVTASVVGGVALVTTVTVGVATNQWAARLRARRTAARSTRT